MGRQPSTSLPLARLQLGYAQPAPWSAERSRPADPTPSARGCFVDKYNAAYAAAFPGGVYVPAFGPPLSYNTGNPRALGGNPDMTPFLQGPVRPPNANEAGWKDTVIMYPGDVTRIAVRFAPMHLPTNTPAEGLHYPFDRNVLGHGYVWHCHIIDHEDNEMMRPYSVIPKTDVTRTYVQGTDY